MIYSANPNRYDTMQYRRCGNSGLKLPAISLGLWHNFSHSEPFTQCQVLCRKAFDLGITHFDLANNYGPPPGSAEENFGQLLATDFAGYRDELIISTKAGYYMWPGPYGEWGSRKNLLASLDQSLKRMGLEYVDIFYSHRFDPDTPLDETMGALQRALDSGKALYVGVSSYKSLATAEANALIREFGTRLLIHQPRYSMLDRWIENDNLLDTLEQEGMGCIVFSPLAQGVLSNKYLNGIPEDSRAALGHFLTPEMLQKMNMDNLRALNDMAAQRGQSLAQMALAWVLKDARVTSALVGASRVGQLEDSVKALDNLAFCQQELEQIDRLTVA
ncbi:L-glyceraldehyde 3-phosphate reductase [Porticoccus sp. GXU_MW_L64]